MKFFYKMFLGMTVILAVALGMIEYVTLSYSLEHAVKREQDSALSQHQMIKYSIETVILNMKSEDVDKELTDMMSQSAKSIVGDDGGEGVHGSRQNITVDVHGIVCLLQLDDHVFQ